jgi:hypothetical protein
MVLASRSDGNGTPSMLFTPVVADDGFKLTAASFYYYGERSGADIAQIIFQSVHENKIVTRLQIDDSGLHILSADAGGNPVFQKLDIGDMPYSTEAFDATMNIQVDRATSKFTLFFNGVKIFEGTGFASAIDQIVFYNSNTTADKLSTLAELWFGKIGGWITIPGNPQVLTSGLQADMFIRVNTLNLPKGVYEDVVRVASNDPARPVITIPVHLEVITPVFNVDATPIQGVSETGKQGGQTVTITNTGDSDLNYVFLGYGLGADQMILPRQDVAPATTGGPDGTGYSWAMSGDPKGTPYVWNDIAETGTRLVLRDYMIKPIDIPFAFPYYGQKLSRVTITSMGALIFGYESVYDLADISFYTIPNPSGANNFISPAGQNFFPDSRSHVAYKGDSEKLIVQFTDFTTGLNADRFTYQAILYNNGTIDFVYKEMHYPLSIIGMENATGTDGLEMDYIVDFDRPIIESTLRITPSAPWIQPQMPEGVVAAGQSQTIPIAFDAANLEPGVYQTTLFIGSNDPNKRAAGIPITFTVTDKIQVGTEEDENTAVKVYPVPSEDVVNIAIDKPTPQGALITLGNAQGQVMYRAEVPAGTTSHQLKLRDLHAPQGIYYVKVDAGGWAEVRKVAKK